MEEQNRNLNHQELLVLYQETTKDLELIKRQQWNAAYYGLLFYAGVFGFFGFWRQIGSKEVPCALAVLIALAVIAFGVSVVVFLRRTYDLIQGKRKRLIRIRGRLSLAFQECFGPDENAGGDNYAFIVWVFVGLTSAGAALTFWFIWFISFVLPTK